MKYGEISSPIIISSSPNPRPGVYGALICLQSNGERKALRRGIPWSLLALLNGCQLVIREGRSTCKNFRSLRAGSREVYRIIITPRWKPDRSSPAKQRMIPWNSQEGMEFTGDWISTLWPQSHSQTYPLKSRG